jgi:hypothetical protein
VGTASLKRAVEDLKARAPSHGRLLIPRDRLEFADSLGIVPDSWQERLLRSEASRVLLNCARQSGKSTMAAILALHRASWCPSSLVLILAPAERQAKELFTKVAEAYRTLGHAIPAESYRKLGMELANGSRIEALPGSERTIRGFSGVDLLLVDEASRVADDLYFAVRPMLAVSGGRLMMLTTPYGGRGVFYEEWTGGEASWERYEVPASECPRIPASECPRIPASFLDEERRSLPRRVFRQEYECSFEETDEQVFAHADVAAAISEEVTPLFGVANG